MIKENLEYLRSFDPDVADAVAAELLRQQSKIELIASENFVSKAILAANSSVQICRRLPLAPLLRRMRMCGYR